MKVKKQFSNECTHGPLHDAENHIRVIFFNTVIDTSFLHQLNCLNSCMSVILYSM
jgi:hypothetical protein